MSSDLVPRYYLNMRGAGETVADPEGSELGTLADAKAEAFRLIFFMASEHLRLRRQMTVEGVDITNEAGIVLASVTIQDALRKEDG